MKTPITTKSERGVSLMEVLAALTIYSLCTTSLIQSFLGQMRHNYNSSVRTAATVAAQQVLDRYRLEDISAIPNSGSNTEVVVIGSRDFDVTAQFCLISSMCSTNNRQITISVEFRDKEVYDVATVFTQLR